MAITGGRGGGGICATAYEPAAKKWNSIREAIAGYQDALQNVLVTFTSPSLPGVPCKRDRCSIYWVETIVRERIVFNCRHMTMSRKRCMSSWRCRVVSSGVARP